MATPIDDNQERVIEEAAREFVDARWRGEEPDVDEFVRQYPHLERQLRQRIQDIREIDALFHTLVQADESDFSGAVTEPGLVGEKLGNFEIVEIIGRGGMGVVYLAHDTKLDRSVAIKSMPSALAGDSTARMRFHREAKLLASLSHPNIAVIHEIIEEEEVAGYLVLEYVSGQTLAERIAKGPLKLEEALSIALQIAEAVAAAHEHYVIHRDLKPRNIKLTPDDRIKVLDFGLAKSTGDEVASQDTEVTQPGSVFGTPVYMSPEQIHGNPVDRRTDIWSFGCVLYEMLTGKRPFEGKTVAGTVAHVLENEPDWQALPQETPANICVLLRRCLEKDPDHRLRDIAEAVIEIREMLGKSNTTLPVTIPAKLKRMAMIIGAVAIGIILFGIALKYIPQKEIIPSVKEIRLAVLPFENLGHVEDDYFSDGITDAITVRLAGIRGLAVISRQSTMQYKKSEKNIQQIAEELGVDYILEGTVQRERPSDPTSRVRVMPQLIRASDDSHVWAQTYDDDMSEVFRLQSDLSERVAQALNITLLEPEQRALQSRPTENIKAYEYYMRGNDYLYRSYLKNDFEIAIRMYEKAVELDLTFALAYARLSGAHAWIYWFYDDHSEERLTMVEQTVNKALELNPDLPETHVALGRYYYYCHLDLDHALEEFAIARKSQPNNSELIFFIAAVQRRQGKFKQALANMKRASELDPLSNRLARQVGITSMIMRRYPEAEQYYERAISLSPDLARLYFWKARLYLLWEGSTEKTRAVLEEGLVNVKSADTADIVNSLIDIDVYDGNYQEALEKLTLESEDIDDQFEFIPKALRLAQIYGYMNKNELAKKYYDEARSILEATTQQRPEDAQPHSSLGIAYAGLGRKEDAIREGELAVEMLPVGKDAWRGCYRVSDLARIYTMVDEFEAAIKRLESLLSIPAELSIPLLKLDPVWNSLHNHPRFKKLIESDK